jgi:hypothetical protein
MRGYSSRMRIFVMSLLLVACQREPAIVIHFDAIDAAHVVDAAHIVDAAMAPDLAPAAHAECTQDSDCALMSDGACDCANGGKQRAFSKHVGKPKVRLGKTMCVAMMSNDPSCAQHAACVAGACTLRP